MRSLLGRRMTNKVWKIPERTGTTPATPPLARPPRTSQPVQSSSHSSASPSPFMHSNSPFRSSRHRRCGPPSREWKILEYFERHPRRKRRHICEGLSVGCREREGLFRPPANPIVGRRLQHRSLIATSTCGNAGFAQRIVHHLAHPPKRRSQNGPVRCNETFYQDVPSYGARHSSQMPQPSSSINDLNLPQHRQVIPPWSDGHSRSGGTISTSVTAIISKTSFSISSAPRFEYSSEMVKLTLETRVQTAWIGDQRR